MFCSACGAEIQDGIEVCSACGKSLVDGEVEAVETSVTQVPAVDPGKTFGLVSLICGIVALALGTICSCLAACLGGAIPFVVAVVGIVFGILGQKKSAEVGLKNKFATIGMILSIVAVAVIIVFIIVNAVLGAMLSLSGDGFDFY